MESVARRIRHTLKNVRMLDDGGVGEAGRYLFENVVENLEYIVSQNDYEDPEVYMAGVAAFGSLSGLTQTIKKKDFFGYADEILREYYAVLEEWLHEITEGS